MSRSKRLIADAHAAPALCITYSVTLISTASADPTSHPLTRSLLLPVCVSSRMAMVSPSATLMTLPSKCLGLHLQHHARRHHGGRRFECHLHGDLFCAWDTGGFPSRADSRLLMPPWAVVKLHRAQSAFHQFALSVTQPAYMPRTLSAPSGRPVTLRPHLPNQLIGAPRQHT